MSGADRPAAAGEGHGDLHGSVPEVPTVASAVFGSAVGDAARYVAMLAGDGVVRGLIGPREVPRLWERHVLNSAALAEAVPRGSRVVDVGSGAGLPGIPLGLARADLSMILVEPMARRVEFLEEAVLALGLVGVRVLRGRADDFGGAVRAAVVTARAVAPLDRLARWTLPLVEPGGRLLAMKGASAAAEVQAHRHAVTAAGGGQIQVRRCGAGLVDPMTTVIEVTRLVAAAPRGAAR